MFASQTISYRRTKFHRWTLKIEVLVAFLAELKIYVDNKQLSLDTKIAKMNETFYK